MKLRFILGLLLAATTFAIHAADVSTNIPAAVADTSTNEPVEAKIPGKNFTNSVGMELVQIPAGFWAGKYEVTQAEYQKVTGANPSISVATNRPVDSVTWDMAVAYCDRLTALDLKKNKIPKGYRYTLPTEDEWTSLVGDATLAQAVTSLKGNTLKSSAPVGSLKANSLGLYDIRGNVLEFCLSDTNKAFRFLKGGSYADFVDVNLRPEFRAYCKPDETKSTFGFRCLLKAK